MHLEIMGNNVKNRAVNDSQQMLKIFVVPLEAKRGRRCAP